MLPRSSHTTLRDSVCSSLRSWLIITMAAEDDSSSRFQPLDGRHVQVVGRLVQQQQVRGRGQGTGQRRPARLPAGQPTRVLGRRPARARTAVRRAMPGIVGPEPGPHVVQRGGMAGQVGLLRQRAQRGARLQEPRAGIRQQLAGRDAQQGRLARAVAPDQAQPLAGRHPEAGAVQQRRAAEGQPYVLEQKQGRRHGAVLADAARLRNTAAGCGYFAAVWCSACCRNNRSATCFC